MMGSKKIQESFLEVEICSSIVTFFIFSPKIVKVLILFHKFFHENSIYRKKGAHHAKADENPLKVSTHNLESKNFVTEIFHRKFA